MSEYFPKPRLLRRNVKVELDLCSYATKPDLKNETGVDTSKLTKKAHLSYLKLEMIH